MASIAWALVSTLGLVGCSMESNGIAGPQTVAEQLQNPTPFSVTQSGSSVLVEGRELPIVRGEIQLGAYTGDVLELDGLDLAFDTMHVSGESPDLEGVELRHVRVSLAHPVVGSVEWTLRGEAGFASLQAELLIDWSVVAPNGDETPLATQHLENIDIALGVYTASDGQLKAELDGARPGVFWSWAGLADLGDLQFSLRAARPGSDDVIP